MAKKIRVGLMFGGESPEHEISIRSAETVVELLNPKRYQIVPLGIARNGKWKMAQKAGQSLTQVLKKGKLFVEWGKLGEKVDLIFPCLHGPFGEDGTIQGLCELLNVPYVGCGVLSSAVGMDKSIQKRLFNQQGLPVLDSYSFEKWSWKLLSDGIVEDIMKRFPFPVFVKPCRLGSSIGISRVDSPKDLEKGLNLAFRHDSKVLIEKAVVSAREFEVSVMGNELPEVSEVGETIPSNEFFDYEAKYKKPSGKRVPAEIPDNVRKQMQVWAGMAYLALDCKGFARVDFLAKPDLSEIYLGEINTIPGLTPTSLFLKLWEASGKKPANVIEQLIQLALDLHKEKVRP